MFTNVLAEMARRQISRQKMSELLNMSVSTFDRKIRKTTEFTLSEIRKIQEIFNDDTCTIDYLFAE